MHVLVDTCIWSLAFRKKNKNPQEERVVQELKDLIFDYRANLIGPIRQELLSGISNENSFYKLKNQMQSFDNVLLTTLTYENAAHYSNICRRNGVQGSNVDFLICSAAIEHNMTIFSTDKDFLNYQKFINIKLHKIDSLGG